MNECTVWIVLIVCITIYLCIDSISNIFIAKYVSETEEEEKEEIRENEEK